MTRRMMIGLAMMLTGGVVASAWAFGPHGGRHAIMRRVAAAEIDDALDRINATPEQRSTVHGVRDRIFAAFEDHAKTRRARMDDVLAAFEADQVDARGVEALRQRAEEEHRKIGDAIVQAFVEVHDVLTTDQRRALVEYVKARRQRFMH